MQTFRLPDWTPVRIESVTVRAEKHGPDDVTGISLHLKMSGDNTILDLVSPTLREGLFAPMENESLPGVPEIRKALRTRDIEDVALPLKKVPKIEGATLYVDYGIDGDANPITMTKTKVDGFAVKVFEGGSAEVYFRVGSNDIDSDEIGKLCSKLRHEINVRVEPPVKVAEAESEGAGASNVIDGRFGHPGAGALFDDGPGDATDAFVAQHAGDFGTDDDDDGAPL